MSMNSDQDNGKYNSEQHSDHVNKPGAAGTGLRGINVFESSGTPPMGYNASGTKTAGVDRDKRNQ